MFSFIPTERTAFIMLNFINSHGITGYCKIYTYREL